MKKITMLFLVVILVFNWIININAQIYDPNSINRAVGKVLQEGILYPDPSFGFRWFDDYINAPDTSTTTGIASYNTVGTGTVAIALDTSGTLWKKVYKRRGNGILRLSAIGTPGIDGAFRNLQTNFNIITDTTSKGVWKRIKYRVSLALNDSTNIGVVAGLTSADSDTLRNYGTNFGVFFEKPYGTNNWTIRSKRAGGTATKTLGNASARLDTGLFTIEFDWIDTNFVRVTIDGQPDSILTKYLPKAGIRLFPSIEVSGADTIGIDYQEVFIRREENPHFLR